MQKIFTNGWILFFSQSHDRGSEFGGHGKGSNATRSPSPYLETSSMPLREEETGSCNFVFFEHIPHLPHSFRHINGKRINHANRHNDYHFTRHRPELSIEFMVELLFGRSTGTEQYLSLPWFHTEAQSHRNSPLSSCFSCQQSCFEYQLILRPDNSGCFEHLNCCFEYQNCCFEYQNCCFEYKKGMFSTSTEI